MKVFLCFVIVSLIVGWTADHRAALENVRSAREDAYESWKRVGQVAKEVAAGKRIAFAYNDSTLAEAIEEVKNGGLNPKTDPYKLFRGKVMVASMREDDHVPRLWQGTEEGLKSATLYLEAAKK